jgi:hypothetical protein
MRSLKLAIIASSILVGLCAQSFAQSLRLGPDGLEVRPPRQDRRPVVVPPRRDEMRDRMLELRQACEEDDKRACVRLGILIGENRARREAWRREHPDVFFYERP